MGDQITQFAHNPQLLTGIGIVVLIGLLALLVLPPRVLVGAAVIVVVQWVVLTRIPDIRWHLVALAVPALLAAAALTTSLTGTSIGRSDHRRGGARR